MICGRRTERMWLICDRELGRVSRKAGRGASKRGDTAVFLELEGGW